MDGLLLAGPAISPLLHGVESHALVCTGGRNLLGSGDAAGLRTWAHGQAQWLQVPVAHCTNRPNRWLVRQPIGGRAVVPGNPVLQARNPVSGHWLLQRGLVEVMPCKSRAHTFLQGLEIRLRVLLLSLFHRNMLPEGLMEEVQRVASIATRSMVLVIVQAVEA